MESYNLVFEEKEQEKVGTHFRSSYNVPRLSPEDQAFEDQVSKRF